MDLYVNCPRQVVIPAKVAQNRYLLNLENLRFQATFSVPVP